MTDYDDFQLSVDGFGGIWIHCVCGDSFDITMSRSEKVRVSRITYAIKRHMAEVHPSD